MQNSHVRYLFLALTLMGLAGWGGHNVLVAAPLFQSSGGWRRPSEQPEQQQSRSSQQQQLSQAGTKAATNSSSSSPRSSADVIRLRQDADELSKLAQSIPGDVDLIANGVLPKDVDQKLKRINRLSKQLRSGITH